MESRTKTASVSQIGAAKTAQLQVRVDQLERENEKLRDEVHHWRSLHFKTVQQQQKEILRLELEVATLKDALADALQQLAWLRKQVFGRKSEQGVADGEPSVATEETELIVSPEPEQPASPAKRTRGQQKGTKGHGRQKRDGSIPTEECWSQLPGLCCKRCSVPFKALKETDDSRLVHHAVDLWLEVWKRVRYVPQCECDGNTIVTAPAPPRLFPRTVFGTTMWLHLVVQKFLFQVPTHKTLQDLAMRGLKVSQGTVTGGFQKIDALIDGLYDGIVNHCRGADLWNADETSWRVFDDSEITGSKKWWLWLISCSDAAVYLLDRTRSAAVPEEFFAASTGTLLTDRYSAYKALKAAIRKAFCWVHVRRDFIAIFEGRTALKAWAGAWIKWIDDLFDCNRDRVDVLTNRAASKQMIQSAQAELEAMITELRVRLDAELSQPKQLQEPQLKALKSMKKHWAGLTTFVEDPRVPMDNNRAERLLRTPVVGRKNYYGSGSEWSGQFAAKMFSIIQTWLMNGLNPCALLLDYFDECSKTPGKPPPGLDRFLPWQMSDERKAQFKLRN